MSARTAQFLIAFVFLALGGWALFAPASVIELAVTEAYRQDTFLARFTMACFGATVPTAGKFTVLPLTEPWAVLAGSVSVSEV